MNEATSATTLAIKRATHLAVTSAGGLLAAAVLLGLKSPSSVARYYDPAAAETIPARAIPLLEAEAGAPLITRVLAGAQGCAVVASVATVLPPAFAQHVARIAREAGDLLAGARAARPDGSLSDGERIALLAQLHELGAAVTAALALLETR